MKLWGVIAEVNEKDIVISLPGGLRGLVRASEAFDPISDNKVKVVTCFFYKEYPNSSSLDIYFLSLCHYYSTAFELIFLI